MSEFEINKQQFNNVSKLSDFTELDNFIDKAFPPTISNQIKTTTYAIIYIMLIIHSSVKQRNLNNFEFLTNDQIYDKYFGLINKLLECYDRQNYDKLFDKFINLSKEIIKKFTVVEWITVWIEKSHKNYNLKWIECYNKLVNYVVSSSTFEIHKTRLNGLVWSSENNPVDKSLLLAYFEQCNMLFAENNEAITKILLSKTINFVTNK